MGVLLGLLFVTPFVLSYALFIRWCDRFEPEPWWLLIVAFFWGAIVATLGGGTMNDLSTTLVQHALGARRDSEEVHAIVATFSAPIFEEGFKGLGVLMIAVISWLGIKELDGPLDGAIYGGIIGLGFTLTEDIMYVTQGFDEGGIGGFFFLLFVRTILGGLGHCTFTAMTGLGFGIAAESRKRWVKILAPLGGYLLAMILHGTHNGLLTLGEEGFAIMQILSWIIDIAFFVVIGVLVARDRKIVIRELEGEVGGLIHPQELGLITTYTKIGRRNLATLFTKGWGEFRRRRKKQLALVELAFLKSRRRRGERGRDLDLKESRLRQEVVLANRQGVWLGA